MVFASLNETGGPQSDGAQGLFSLLFAQLWDVPETIAWGAPVLAGCGFAFAWWARLHLGALWSSSVTRKEDHRIVDSGPYGIVRHPIYTGMLIGTLALVAVSGRVLALAGFAILALGIYIKARLEERFLSAELGADAYLAYRSRVPMLVPGAPA
jgi:protein-S-isoprenylcysteine O-methyltransferase Ste14